MRDVDKALRYADMLMGTLPLLGVKEPVGVSVARSIVQAARAALQSGRSGDEIVEELRRFQRSPAERTNLDAIAEKFAQDD